MPKKRMQSPSSINTYKQCPRKYYYKYNLSLPTKTNVHQLRGKIAHAVLEDFFDIEPSTLTFENVEKTLKKRIQELFIAHWQLNQEGMANFGLAEDQVKFYSSETIVMLFNFFNQFLQNLKFQSTKNTFFIILCTQTPSLYFVYKKKCAVLSKI